MRSAATAAAAALALTLATAPPAGALSGEPERTVPVWPGVERTEWRLRTDDGETAHAQVVTVSPDADVDFELVLGGDTIPGLERVPDMARRTIDDGAVLGINGGFWRTSPPGRPEGLTVMDGRLAVEGETRGDPEVGRGAFGVRRDGTPVIDRVLPQRVDLQGVDTAGTDRGINRYDRGAPHPDGPDALYLITDQYASTVTLPDTDDRGTASVRRLDGLTVAPRGTGQAGRAGSLRTVAAGQTLSVPDVGALLVGYGSTGRAAVEGASDDATVTPDLSLDIRNPVPGRTASRWADISVGLTAGPHILRAGSLTSSGSWEREGFAPAHHARNPRTAVGTTPDGTKLLVVVDGRDDARSVGLSTRETAVFFANLGAREATLLDGGGSSTMVHGLSTVNRPSDGRPRLVANGLFLTHDEHFAHTERLAGRDRVATAADAARAAFPAGADQAVLAAAGDFPDALAGGPLAARLDAPLLLTSSSGVSDDTLAALSDLGTRRVTLVGGTAAVSGSVAGELRDAGYEVRRHSGATRFATAAAIAPHVAESPERVVLASGHGFADALVAAAPAGMMGAPILLAAPDDLPDVTEQALAELDPAEIVMVGGTAALSAAVEEQAGEAAPDADVIRLAGATRYGTARAINEWADGEASSEGLIVARGDAFPDALAGGSLAAARDHLLMIVPRWDVEADRDAAAYLRQRGDAGLDGVTLLGGHAVLTAYQEWQLDRLAR